MFSLRRRTVEKLRHLHGRKPGLEDIRLVTLTQKFLDADGVKGDAQGLDKGGTHL